MATMGRYCRAYPVKSFREFERWSERSGALRPDRARDDESGPPLRETDCLYLQENLVVTDGIFVDEHVVFDDVTDEWRAFCANTLKFDVPSQI